MQFSTICNKRKNTGAFCVTLKVLTANHDEVLLGNDQACILKTELINEMKGPNGPEPNTNLRFNIAMLQSQAFAIPCSKWKRIYTTGRKLWWKKKWHVAFFAYLIERNHEFFF